MSELTQLIEKRREAYAESLRALLTDSAAAVALVRDELKERDELKAEEE